MKLVGIFLALPAFALIFTGIEYLYRFRASAMRSLAARWNLQYSDGHPRIWSAGRNTALPHPARFKMACYPAHEISRMWNVIDGQRNGNRVLIFDSTVGGKRGIYCSFVAVQTNENLFESDSSREKIVQCSGWIAAYRTRFLQVPWTLSVTRIEELLNRL
jgi:hypothetical protein